MPSKIRDHLQSFSFRVGLVFFAALCTTLVVLRVQIYYQSISTTYQDIRGLINAHEIEIDQGIERYGATYAKYLVHAVLEEVNDKNLYLLFRDGKSLTGNLDEWPADLDPEATWQETSVVTGEDRRRVHMLVKILPYKHKTYTLLIGYDLQRLDLLRKALLRVMISNLILSLFLSFAVSIVVVWLINRYLMRINRAAQRVVQGEIQHRMPEGGGNDQFDQLSRNLNAMLDWIVTLLGTVRDSTNALAHDMRTPLSRHRLELRALMEDKDLTPAARDKIARATRNVDGIVEMFDNILSIAKAESRTGTELFAPFDITETVENVIEFYAPLMEERKQKLAPDLPAWPVQMVGDKQLMTQAIVNILDNAVKYTPAGGEIGISLRAEAENIVVSITDTGPGIPVELLDKAKERFFRVDESRGTPGTGLGLSLANAVAGLHHGTLTLENNNPGLRVTLRVAVD